MTIESNEIMVSFDVVSLFTKIPVSLALQIVEDRLQACQNLEEIRIGRWMIFARV